MGAADATPWRQGIDAPAQTRENMANSLPVLLSLSTFARTRCHVSVILGSYTLLSAFIRTARPMGRLPVLWSLLSILFAQSALRAIKDVPAPRGPGVPSHWPVLATCGIRPPVEAFESTQSHPSSLLIPQRKSTITSIDSLIFTKG